MSMLPAVVIDLETTGLDPSTDEVLEVAVVDINGEEYMNTFVRPVNRSEWPEAQRIHGIAPEDMENAPTLRSLAEEIKESVRDRVVVIYNAEFDAEFLKDLLKGARAVICAMEAFAAEYQAREGGEGRWQKLVHAAHYVDHDWGQDAAHRAIHDAHATVSVYRWLARVAPEQNPLESKARGTAA
jgi:DNA polymerase III epsilon subunit-like protein